MSPRDEPVRVISRVAPSNVERLPSAPRTKPSENSVRPADRKAPTAAGSTSLLTTAGIFAARGDLNIVWLNISLVIAAIAGDATGYWIGRRAGQTLYSRPNSLLFRRDHLIRTHEFYERYGGQTIIIARFIPIVRTFAPVVAGAADMTYRQFATYNIIGALLWVPSMTLTGYFLGLAFPDIDKQLHKLVALIIAVSLLPAGIAWLRAKMQDRKRAAES